MNMEYLAIAATLVVVIAAIAWALKSRVEARRARAAMAVLEDLANGRLSKDESEQVLRRVDSTGTTGWLDRTGVLLGLFLAVAAIGTAGALYWVVSRSGEKTGPTTAAKTPMPQATQAGDAAAKSGGDLRSLVGPLAKRLEANPADGAGWLLLARTYAEIGQSAEAAQAFRKAAGLVKPDAQFLAEWAGVNVAVAGGVWTDEARDLLKRALAADPANATAQGLKAKASGVPGTGDEVAPQRPRADAGNVVTGGAPAAGAIEVSGTVALDPKVKAQLGANDVVFVIAKDKSGSGPPLAAKRIQASQLPYEFRLTDADAMMPGRGLSSVTDVLVSARLSKTGDAVKSASDLESSAITVPVGSKSVRLSIPDRK